MTLPTQDAAGLPPKGPFEAAMKYLYPTWTFQSDGVGGYHNHYTEMAWIAWQGGYRAAPGALAAVAPAPAPAVPEGVKLESDDPGGPGWKHRREVVARMRAQLDASPSTGVTQDKGEPSDTEMLDWLEEQQDVTWQTNEGQWSGCDGPSLRGILSSRIARARTSTPPAAPAPAVTVGWQHPGPWAVIDPDLTCPSLERIGFKYNADAYAWIEANAGELSPGLVVASVSDYVCDIASPGALSAVAPAPAPVVPEGVKQFKLDPPPIYDKHYWDAASPSTGVLAFDHSQQCSPYLTECPRCKNPHHKCDRGGVTEDKTEERK